MATQAVSAARQTTMARAPAANLAARSSALVGHHTDRANPDKPLYLLLPGGALAVVSLLWAIYSAYLGIMTKTPANQAWLSGIVSVVLYLLGLFVFSYGYQLYDVTRAVRMTIKLGLVGLALLFVVAVIFLIIAALAKGDSDVDFSSDSGSGSSGGSSGGGGGGLSVMGRMFDWATRMPDVTNAIVNTVGQNLPTLPFAATTMPGTCPFCTRPLPPDGALVAQTPLEGYCPRCGQPFIAAGDAVRAGSAR